MTIFADTSAIISLFDEQDPNHLQAQALSSHLKPADVITLISNFVFAEIVTILSKKLGKEESNQIGKYIKINLRIIRLTEETENLAWEIFKKQRSKNVSFVDCTIFALYKDGAFDKAFTFDSDFKTNKIPILE